MSKVLLVCAFVLVLSCGGGQRGDRRAYACDDLWGFLEGYRQAVVENDTTLILEEYIDPLYRREQLEELLRGNQRQFFDELFGLGERRFADIVEVEFVDADIRFETLEYGACPGAQGAPCPVVLTYEDGVRVEDCIYLIKYPDHERTFAVEGPRG